MTVPPSGIRYIAQANSLRQLCARTSPDCVWKEPDGTYFCVWCRTNAQGLVFTLDRPYIFQIGGTHQWCFIDPSSGDGLKFEHPIRQFLACQFVREIIVVGAYHGDGNQSYAELLAKSPTGAAVYKIVYSSEAGARAHQEEIRTFVVYISPLGQCSLAARDIGREGNSKGGMIGYYHSLQLKVGWLEKNSPAPIEIEIKQFELMAETGESATLPPLEIFQEGKLSGSFPLTKTMSGVGYVESDGTMTLAKLSSILTSYEVYGLNEAALDSIKKNLTKLWLQSLMEWNRNFREDELLPKGAAIALPPGHRLIALNSALLH